MTEQQKTFTDLGLDPTLADALGERGITNPFPIQELTLPMALKGADIIGQARTGTGKTLAFGLPLLQRIDPDLQQTQALVVVPTRELCLQVADDVEVGAVRGVRSIAVYGGVGYDEQIEALTTGVHVVVGTPGRLLDHLNRGNLDLSQVRIAVLDEADEMLDMGFLPDVERLLSACPGDRQTLLFSATMPTAIVKLARRFMDHPTFMRADAELHETAPTVDQHFFLVHRMDKPRVLARLLQIDGRGGAFVFTRTKNMADRLVRELEDLKVKAIAVHGDLRQATREKNMDRFREGKADVLVATEVAARGLDVTNVTHVVNYDCPDDEKMYLHRIGRTARAGAKGLAITFAEFNEVDRVNVIRKAVGVEDELVEIFSTSDALTDLFDLPEETPWDHLVRASRSSGGRSTGGDRSGGGRSGGGRSGGDRSRDDRPTGRSSGKSRSRSSSQGGGQSDRAEGRNRSNRAPSSRDEAGTTSDDSASKARRERPSRSSDRATGSSEPSRERTRTRTRDTGSSTRDRDRDTTGGDRGRTRGDGGEGDRKGSDGAGSDRSSSRSGGDRNSSGRTRARARGGRGSGGNDAERSSGEAARDRGADERRSERSGQRSRGGDKRRQGDSRDERSGTGRGGSSSRGRNDSGGNDRGGNDRDERADRAANGSRTRATRRGDDARGDGTPRFSRRVEVEHLP